MPVFGLGFEGPYGVYHSAYDDFFWMNHFGDPGYRYHTLMSQLWGVLALRLANADLLPFDFASYADNIRQFVNELSKQRKHVGQPPSLSSAKLGASGSSPSSTPSMTSKPPASAYESASRTLASGAIDPNLAATINHGDDAGRTQLAES